EALHRVVVRAPDRARELRRDVEPGAVAPGLVRRAVDVLHSAGDLLGREHGRHPALAVLAGPPADLRMVAAGVHRQRRLARLGIALHVLEADVAPAEARPALGEQQAQGPHALVGDVAPAGIAG